VVTDVKVGHKMFHAATLTLTFEGNTTDVEVVKDASGMPLSSEQCGPNGLAGFNGHGPGPNGPFFYALSKGRASLRVESEGKAISAQFAPGQVFMPFHFSEHNSNLVTLGAFDPISREPNFKQCAVRVERTTASIVDHLTQRSQAAGRDAAAR